MYINAYLRFMQGGQQLCMLELKVGLNSTNSSFDSSATSSLTWRFDNAARGRRGESVIELFETKAEFERCRIRTPRIGTGTSM